MALRSRPTDGTYGTDGTNGMARWPIGLNRLLRHNPRIAVSPHRPFAVSPFRPFAVSPFPLFLGVLARPRSFTCRAVEIPVDYDGPARGFFLSYGTTLQF